MYEAWGRKCLGFTQREEPVPVSRCCSIHMDKGDPTKPTEREKMFSHPFFPEDLFGRAQDEIR